VQSNSGAQPSDAGATEREATIRGMYPKLFGVAVPWSEVPSAEAATQFQGLEENGNGALSRIARAGLEGDKALVVVARELDVERAKSRDSANGNGPSANGTADSEGDKR